MPKKIIAFCCFSFIFLFSAATLFSAENRYALVIGNQKYQDRNIAPLTTPANDAADIAAVLTDLGYNVTLKSNIGLREMLDVIQDFSNKLRSSSQTEGFFWFAGHGLSIRGIHYLLPVDVDPVNDNIIARGSYSVDDLMGEIGNARNRTNLVVIDACRNTALPGGNRTVGGRGVAILAADDYGVAGNKIVYSTMAGRTASDGDPGARNSPFAKAFIDNMRKSESFDDVFLDIANETMRLTNGNQQPYAMGSFAVKSYSLNPRPIALSPPVPAAPQAPAGPASPVPLPSAGPVPMNPAQPNEIKPPRDMTEFSLDGKKVLSIGTAPFFDISHLTFSGSLTCAFYEKYGPYGNFFFIPNSFFVSAELLYYTVEYPQKSGPFGYKAGGQEGLTGGIFGLGALYKIRLDRDQRFILNFGPSFILFAGKNKTDFQYTNNTGTTGDVTSSKSVFPGIGVSGGLSFRFTRLISLDLALAMKTLFGTLNGASASDSKKIDIPGPYDIGNEIIYKDTKPAPNIFFTAGLGLTLWFPR